MSATRAAESSRPVSCGSRGPGVPAARRWPRARPSIFRTRTPVWSRGRRSTSRLRARGDAARAAARPRRLLLRARRRGARSREPRGSACRRLDRRARRPQHARVVAFRQPWGMPLRMLLDDGVVVARGRRARRGAETSTRREIDFIARPGSTTRSSGRSTAVDAVYVALDLDVLDPGEATCSCRSRTGRRRARSRRSCGRVAGAGSPASA